MKMQKNIWVRIFIIKGPIKMLDDSLSNPFESYHDKYFPLFKPTNPINQMKPAYDPIW